MLNSVLIENEDPSKQNSEPLSNNHPNRLMIEYFQKKEIDNTPKPVTEKEVRTKLPEYKMHAASLNGEKSYEGEIIFTHEKKKRTRLVVKKGPENIPVALGKIALIYTENKIVYAVNENGNKYIVEEKLTTLAQTLNEQFFFRANRQYIININYIKSFRTYERVKLKIDLTLDDINNQHSIIISQESAAAFKKWIHSA